MAYILFLTIITVIIKEDDVWQIIYLQKKQKIKLLIFFFYAKIIIVIRFRGIVLMVAHRSPKPPVWVRILLPLP